MCACIRLEMSKHSIRIGIDHLERLLEAVERLDALRAAQLEQPVLVEREPGVALGQLLDAPLVAALGVLPTSTGAAALGEGVGERLRCGDAARHDHLRRHGDRAGRSTGGRTLGHLALVAARRVLEIEAWRSWSTPSRTWKICALASASSAATPIASSVPTVSLAMRWRSSRLRTALRSAAQHRRLLELLLLGRPLHPLVERAFDLAIATRQEVDDRLDVGPVLLLRDVADAGRLAALDEVVEAGLPPARPGSGPSQVRYWKTLPSRSSVRARAWRC